VGYNSHILQLFGLIFLGGATTSLSQNSTDKAILGF
jgi:hypothetical protein